MTVTIQLSDEQAAALQAQAAQEGLTVEGWLQQLAEQHIHWRFSACASEDRPIWDVILDNMKDVPPAEFEKLPKDGASQHDHYLYGYPKRRK
jgi:hypothetical protein